MIFETTSLRAPRSIGRAENGLVAVVEALTRRVGSANDMAPREGDADELARRAMTAAVQAERRIAELTQRIADLRALAATDELTGVLNRRGFEDELRRALAAARRYDETGVLVYVDLDGFKRINDRHGHAAGDAALCHVARFLKERTRVTDGVGRLGGDEFALLLTRTSFDNGAKRMEALAMELAETPLLWRDRRVPVGASFGAVAYSAATDPSVERMMEEADRAMYAVKGSRRAGAERRVA